VANVHKGYRAIDTHLHRNAYRILVGKLEGKRLLGILGHIWQDNIKMNVREIDWGDIDWINLV
jgi:hypothetical protein